MSFNYRLGEIWLDDLASSGPANAVGHVDAAGRLDDGYAMCDAHADRMSPPVGWMLTDRRAAERTLFLHLEVA